jgi:hypothetical protein
MKFQIVELPLLAVRKTFILPLLTWTAILTLPLVFLSSIFWSGKITVIIFGMFMVSVVLMQLMRTYEIVGTLRLTKDEIIVTNAQEQISFSVLAVTKLGISLSGIAGEFNKGRSVMMNRGDFNYLNFRYQGKKKQFRFLMKDEFVNSLRSVLEAWSENNIPYNLQNSSWQKFPSPK